NAGGSARLPAGSGTVLVVNSLSIAQGTALDLSDNRMILHTPAGSWNGNAYTGVAGLIQSGRNGGGWNGAGTVTPDTRAAGNTPLATLAFAKVGAVRSIADNQTASFAGQTVLGSDTIVMLTWAGDATLDGNINIDDYVRMDSAVPIGGTGYFNGDI